MQKRIGEEFEGTVMGVTGHGFFVSLAEVAVEGFVPVELPGGDRYQLNRNGETLYCRKSGEEIGLGARFKLTLVNVNPKRRQIEFRRIERLA